MPELNLTRDEQVVQGTVSQIAARLLDSELNNLLETYYELLASPLMHAGTVWERIVVQELERCYMERIEPPKDVEKK